MDESFPAASPPPDDPDRSGDRQTGASAPGRAKTLVTVRSGDWLGLDGWPVDVQVDVGRSSTPSFTIVGLPGRSTRESRDRIRAAIVNSGFVFPKARVLVNLAPASREKQGVGFDLPVALAFLLATRQVRPARGDREFAERLRTSAFLAELGLHGELRPVRGALVTADGLVRHGVRRLAVAEGNAAEVALLPGLEVWGPRDLREAVAVLRGEAATARVRPGRQATAPPAQSDALDFAEVRGQETTKRGCLVAAAGGHNLLLRGPPGVGKTMLARRLPGILPSLARESALEVLRVRSVLRDADGSDGLPRERPFRAPHHTVSFAGLVGGGSAPLPGEVTRAHRGVLFLDELPEFSRQALEALREPLETGEITIGRSRGAVTFPADFLLVAAMNPCPCGWLGHPRRECRCSPRRVEAYVGRISGPLLDRIDLVAGVGRVDPGDLLDARGEEGLGTRELRERVERARRLQADRWGESWTNARVPLRRLLRSEFTEPGASARLRTWAEKLDLSARGFARALRVARTVADLDGASRTGPGHVLEALEFRGPGAS